MLENREYHERFMREALNMVRSLPDNLFIVLSLMYVIGGAGFDKR
jgi:hypothetical protein